jgi:hypothetical protein
MYPWTSLERYVLGRIYSVLTPFSNGRWVHKSFYWHQIDSEPCCCHWRYSFLLFVTHILICVTSSVQGSCLLAESIALRSTIHSHCLRYIFRRLRHNYTNSITCSARLTRHPLINSVTPNTSMSRYVRHGILWLLVMILSYHMSLGAGTTLSKTVIFPMVLHLPPDSEPNLILLLKALSRLSAR